MSLAIPKSAILASLFGPFVVSKQFLAAMSLQIEDVRRERFMLPREIIHFFVENQIVRINTRFTMKTDRGLNVFSVTRCTNRVFPVKLTTVAILYNF